MPAISERAHALGDDSIGVGMCRRRSPARCMSRSSSGFRPNRELPRWQARSAIVAPQFVVHRTATDGRGAMPAVSYNLQHCREEFFCSALGPVRVTIAPHVAGVVQALPR
jgi:hypothetical protein